jgi:hypothetical protein
MVNPFSAVLSRRIFLRRLAALPAAIAGAAAPLQAEPAQRQTIVGRFSVAGFRYYRGPELIVRIHAGAPIRLIAEPENPYDPMAVRVDLGSEKLGYIPRRENQAISRLLLSGARVNARVAEVHPEEEPWRMLVVEALLNWS